MGRWGLGIAALLWLCVSPLSMANTVALANGEMTWADQPYAPHATNVWQSVTLRDIGRTFPPDGAQYAWYRFEFDIQDPGALVYALRMDRIGRISAIYLNDALIYDQGSHARYFHVRHFVSRFVEVPPALVLAGRNALLIEQVFEPGTKPGMAGLVFGPAADVRPGYGRYVFLTSGIRAALNVAAMVFGLLMLQIWLARRSEKAIGVFGLLCVLSSMRTELYFSEYALIARPFFDWFFFSVNAVTPLLLALFSMLFSGRHRATYLAVTVGVALFLPTVAAVSLLTGYMDYVRLAGYPIIIAASVPAIWLMLDEARRRSSYTLWALGLSLAFTVIAAVHDYLLSRGMMPIKDVYWLAYALPMVFLSYGAHLIGHLVRATNQVEELNLSLEKRVQDRTRKLEAANMAKTRFLASASHDLRQPIHTVSLLVGLLRDKASEPALLDLVGRIRRAVAAMEDLLKGLLDISRLDAGAVEPEFHAVRIESVFQSLRVHLEPEAESRGLELRIRHSPAIVSTDPVIFERVLRNLVANALKYTRKGGVVVGVRRAGQGFLRVAVCDTGIGIPADKQEEIFQEFYQIDNVQRDRSKGLGLGLSIVQRSVDLLGHRVTLSSRPGKGSCFSIILPGLSHQNTRETDSWLPDKVFSLSGMRVALVEDEAAVRESMAQVLHHFGAEVVAAPGLQALQAALEEARVVPDLLISDFRLEKDNGLAVIRAAKARYDNALPCLLVTGDTAPEDVEDIRRANVPVLFKPFGATELRAALEALLR
ncbi:hybrid sensor histidine kinase/response regulator [Alcanivorax sp. JB21]|uniref:ATP-binding response regulator n=1 Tax=Alcanivorax limicola TaxID=2874102 RepID=UPI001CBB7FA9|nr:hybrid sensor histidine kinase/response regulator [Alcanivorax limicola]MBZ2188985.1 hybrid sensor histidine kinase/response regulator [Alcanivorax limicola]